MSINQHNLHSIIRSLQSKLQTQKSQASIISTRYEESLKSAKHHYQSIISQKDQIIQYLKNQLVQFKVINHEEISLANSRQVISKQIMEKQIDKYKNKCQQLEKKLQTLMEKYQLKNKELQGEISKLKSLEDQKIRKKSNIYLQIEKMNKFYLQHKNSSKSQSLSGATLDKIVSRLSKVQQQEDIKTKDIYQYIKNTIQNLKTELVKNQKGSIEIHEQISTQSQQFMIVLKQILEKDKSELKAISEENQSFWQNIKKEKIGSNKEKILSLQNQIIQNKKQHQLIIEELTTKNKNFQSEIKTLFLGFTELKSLNQSREKGYREQILTLKQTIDKLLQNQQSRQQQFSHQVKTLQEQISSINTRYYQNIQIPLYSIQKKINCELESAKNELQDLQRNPRFKQSIQQLQRQMCLYLNDHKHLEAQSLLLSYLKNTNQFVYVANKSIQSEPTFRDSVSRFGQSIEKEATEANISLNIIQSKEKENKYIYQINTLKKHNQKLKQYCKNLEIQFNGKNKNSSTFHNSSLQSQLKCKKVVSYNQKIIELESKVQNLQTLNKSYEEQLLVKTQNLKQSLHFPQSSSFQQHNIHSSISKILEFNQSLEQFVKSENQHINTMKKTINILNNLLVRPVETFEKLVQQITRSEQSNEPFKPSRMNKSSTISAHPQNIKSTLNQIYNRRNDNQSSSNKLFHELIKTIRETLPVRQTKLCKMHHKGSQNTANNSHLVQVTTKNKNIEKRIKQIQQMRVKSSQVLFKKLEKMEQTLTNIEHKYSKKSKHNLEKVYQTIEKRLIEIIEKINHKKNNSEMSNISTSMIKQLRTKLKDSESEKEGITKQMGLLESYLKNLKDKIQEK